MSGLRLFEGRPEDETGRLPREIRVYDYLDGLGIPFRRTDHKEVATMEDLYEADRVLDVVLCKNLFLCNRQKTDFYLLAMPADKPFKTKELSGQLNISRLSFGDPADLLKYLDIEPGAVSVMGLMNDTDKQVRLLMDEDLREDEFFGCHPCVTTSSMKLGMSDLLTRFLPATGHEVTWVRLKGE